MKNEIWKFINGYENLYMVSNFGDIKSLNYHRSGREQLMIPTATNKGYLEICLHKNNKQKVMRVHRIVAEAFIPNPLNLPEINHINEDKTDNRVENLEWCTAKYNSNYGTRKARHKEKLLNHTKMSKPVIGISVNDSHIIEFPSANEAKRQGFAQSAITQCCLNKYGTKKNIYKGFIWKYKEEAV